MTDAERERAIRAEYAPDVSPGDVIHAEPDGTIVLDDGITTWNPSRAVAFLLAERERVLAQQLVDALDAERETVERVLRERIEALPTTRNGADSAAKYPRSAWDFRRDVLKVFDDE